MVYSFSVLINFYICQSNYKSFLLWLNQNFYFLENTDYAEIDIQVYYWNKNH